MIDITRCEQTGKPAGTDNTDKGECPCAPCQLQVVMKEKADLVAAQQATAAFLFKQCVGWQFQAEQNEAECQRLRKRLDAVWELTEEWDRHGGVAEVGQIVSEMRHAVVGDADGAE
jgi:hypothetical protein